MPGRLSCCLDYESGKRQKGFIRPELKDRDTDCEEDDGTEHYGKSEGSSEDEEAETEVSSDEEEEEEGARTATSAASVKSW